MSPFTFADFEVKESATTYSGASYYLNDPVNNLQGLVRECSRNLKSVDFDTLVGTGFSGGIVVPTLALALGKHWALVRKEGVQSHASRTVEGTIGKRWVFLDDLIASGNTESRVYKAVHDVTTQRQRNFNSWELEALPEDRQDRPVYVGAYLYDDHRFLRSIEGARIGEE